MKRNQRKEQARHRQVNVRLSEQELTDLNAAADRLDVPAAELLREGWPLKVKQLERSR